LGWRARNEGVRSGGFWAGGGRVGEGEVTVVKGEVAGRVGVVLGLKALPFMFHVEHPLNRNRGRREPERPRSRCGDNPNSVAG